MDPKKDNSQCMDHEGEILMGVCLEKDCKFQSRLVCFYCITGEHKQHSNSVIKSNDLGKDALAIKKWPFNNQGREMKQLIQESFLLGDKGLEIIDKIFDEHTKAILYEIEKARKQVKRNIEQEKEQQNIGKNTDILKIVLNDIFNLGQIKNTFNSVIEGKINTIDFNMTVNEFLRNLESNEVQSQITQVLDVELSKPAELKLNIECINRVFKDACTEIQKIPEIAFSQVDAVTFTPATKHLKKPNEILEITPGLEYQIITSNSAIITNTLNPEQKYSFQIQIVGTIPSCCCMFGLLPENLKQDSSTAYSTNPFKCFTTSCCTYKTGDGCDTSFIANGIMMFEIDFKQNIYSYAWKHNNQWATLSGYSIIGKKMVFFINSFNGSNLQFKMISSQAI